MNAATALPTPTADWALFLDFDGTLVDIAPTPDAVTPADDLPAVLDAIAARLDGALAVVSGRPIAQLDHFLAPLQPAAAGLHGLELRPKPDADVERQLSPAQQDAVDAARQTLTAFANDHPALLLEDKRLALALHYRGAPELAEQCQTVARQAAADADGVLGLLEGKMVLELKPDGVDKGTVIERLMSALPFRGRIPVFIGDDVTDEYGFAAVNRLNGISIQVADTDDPNTKACYRIDDVAALLNWLRRWPAAMEQ